MGGYLMASIGLVRRFWQEQPTAVTLLSQQIGTVVSVTDKGFVFRTLFRRCEEKKFVVEKMDPEDPSGDELFPWTWFSETSRRLVTPGVTLQLESRYEDSVQYRGGVKEFGRNRRKKCTSCRILKP
jgi:hypothetical protein